MTSSETFPPYGDHHSKAVSPLSPVSPFNSHSRTFSMSSDRPSMTGSGFGGMFSMPSVVSPEPNYIAPSAASQIVTNDHDSQADSWFDQHGIEPSGETAMVAAPAMKLVNRFLDQLLFNFLATAKSVSLSSLRPAVMEVLKPKLAQGAIYGADQELNEYLGGGEDEELLAFHNGLEPSGEWDLELVWKRTRLRCMVYSSLGDMEEEDEDRYTEEGDLEGSGSNQFSNSSGVVSPAVAIFLTSILEFMGEQALIVAGQTAYHRLRAKHEKNEQEGTNMVGEIADRVVVTDTDMERVALDRTLGRLWRGWKKRIRSPNQSVSMNRSFSRESLKNRIPSRRGSTGEPTIPTVEEIPRKASVTESMIHENAASIALPLGEDDVREIEVPGLAQYSDDEDDGYESDSEAVAIKPRPKSMIIGHRAVDTANTDSKLKTPILLAAVGRKRSNSVPTPSASSFMAHRKQHNLAKEADNVPASDDVPAADDVPASENVPAADIPASDDIQASDDVPATDDVLAAKDVSAPDDVLAAKDIPASDDVPAAKDVSASDDVPAAEKLPAADPQVDDSAEKSADSTKIVQDKENEKKAEPATSTDKGVIAGVIAGVGAVGLAAVAGITAAAKGLPPQTDAIADSDMEDEEVQIMTSSRVSVGGRKSPDETTIQSRASSARPHSVQSLRLVDIAHSPTRSRQGSVGSMDYMSSRPAGLSRNNSIHSHTEQGRTGTPIQRTATASPITRTISNHHQSRTSSDDIIDEVEERELPSNSTVSAAVAVPDRSPLRAHAVLTSQDTKTKRDQIADASPVMSANTPYFNEPQFVLAAAPVTRATREREAYSAQQSRTHESPMLKTPESGAPPLTPLREMMEGAPDTSDEASSIAPSVETADGRPSISMPHPYRHYEGRRSPEQPRSVPNTNSPQRVKNSPRRDDDSTPKPYSVSKNDRQLHTSGSSTSSGSHKVRPIRTSEDSHTNGGGKSFEELIQSDQTIQYTLTPQSMRHIEGPDSPHESTMGVSRRRSNSNKSTKSISRATGLNSNPPLESRTTPKSPAKLHKPGTVPRSNQNTANVGSRIRPNAPQARDARVERDSISDFADFIRSTGPPGVSLPPTSNGPRGQNGAVHKPSAVRTAAGMSVISEPPRSSSSSATRRLQARDAVIPTGDHSSDLIDFIRQGPPNEKTHDNPRIPRTVAPFRTTMDSDQMSGAAGGRASDLTQTGFRNSIASGSVTNENSMQSMHSSVNSQSALLNSYKSANPKPAPQSHNTFDEEDHMPKRKQRRVRDPYAIDFSDEEDDFDALPVRKPQRQEESLIDFLNNVPPPPPTVTSVFDDVPKPVLKKSSSQGLMSRFSRHGSITESNTKLTRKDSQSHSTHQSTSTSTRVNGHAPQAPPAHIPISVTLPSTSTTNNKYNGVSSRPTERDNYTSRLDSERNPGARPRVQQKQFQPRDPVSRPMRSGAADLADFLMNTPPPPGNGAQPNFGMVDDEEKSGSGSGFVRSVFGRRKKATA